MIRKPFVALNIVLVVGMLTTVADLDDNPQVPTDEVNNERTDRLRTDEFMSIQRARSQPIPKPRFCYCRISAKAS
jgi:hypothetical protein